MLYDEKFKALLILCIISAVIFLLSAYTNKTAFAVEEQFGIAPNMMLLFVIYILSGIITALMVYHPLMNDRKYKQGSTVAKALLLFILAQCCWLLVLFHTKPGSGSAPFSMFLFILSWIWLAWVCYHLDNKTIGYIIILTVWVAYLTLFTYNVELHWK